MAACVLFMSEVAVLLPLLLLLDLRRPSVEIRRYWESDAAGGFHVHIKMKI